LVLVLFMFGCVETGCVVLNHQLINAVLFKFFWFCFIVLVFVSNAASFTAAYL